MKTKTMLSKIIQWLELEGILKNHPIPSPLPWAETISPGLSQDGTEGVSFFN